MAIDELLERVRATNKLPGLAPAVVRGGETVAAGAAGFRKDGSQERVTVRDKWHIGSCTKSMTAVLAAMLVEEGKWRWDMTLAEMFPEFFKQMQAEWRGVTLEQLLAHHGGAPPTLDENDLWDRVLERGGEPPAEQHEYLTRELLTRQKPVATPGTKYIYSNAGYTVVGHALETRLGKTWEDALRERLFHPLGMDSAGFGAPGSASKVDEPWGHIVIMDGRLVPIPPVQKADYPAAFGPAGTVHCSIGDLAAYAAFHVRGARGEGTLLKPETFKKLHTSFDRDEGYACGWRVLSRPWGGGEVLWHNGSNALNFTVAWLAPKKDFAVVVCTNLASDGAKRAVDTVASALIGEFLLGQ